MAQEGTAILFTTRADNGEASIIEDIEFIKQYRARQRGTASTFTAMKDSGGHRLTIRNNIFEDIDGQKWNGSGTFYENRPLGTV